MTSSSKSISKEPSGICYETSSSSDEDNESTSSDSSPPPLSQSKDDKTKDARKLKTKVKFKFVSNALLYDGVLRRKRRAEKLNDTIEERQRASDCSLMRQRHAEEARSQRNIDDLNSSAERLDALRYLTGHVYRASQLCNLDSKTPSTRLPTYKHILERGFEEALRDEVSQIVLSKVKDTRKETMDRVLRRQRRTTDSLMQQGLLLVDKFVADRPMHIDDDIF